MIKLKHFWGPGLQGHKKVDEKFPYQDVYFAILTLNRESKSASSRGEFHQALGKNTLNKLRPVGTESNCHRVPLIILSNKGSQDSWVPRSLCQAFLSTIHFFRVFTNMRFGKLECICICSIPLKTDLAIIIINIFSIQRIIISLWQIHIDQQLDKMQHHLGDKLLAMSTTDYGIIIRIIKTERPIFTLEWHCSMFQGLNKKAQESWAPEFVILCFPNSVTNNCLKVLPPLPLDH